MRCLIYKMLQLEPLMCRPAVYLRHRHVIWFFLKWIVNQSLVRPSVHYIVTLVSSEDVENFHVIIVIVCSCVRLQLDLAVYLPQRHLTYWLARPILRTYIIAFVRNSSVECFFFVLLTWIDIINFGLGWSAPIQVTLCPIDSQNGLVAMVTMSLNPLTWGRTSFRVLCSAALKRSKDLSHGIVVGSPGEK